MIRSGEEGRKEQRTFSDGSNKNLEGGPAGLISVFSAALFLVDSELQVVKSNSAASRLLGNQGGDSLTNLLNMSIACKPGALRKQLRDAITEGISTNLVLRTEKFDPLICTVRPLQLDLGACGLVGVIPLTGGSEAVIPSLRNIYKLSKAEAEIAAASAAGMDVIELAQTRRVSINTLRAQIASIKSKMGLSRMTEIAVVVCRIEAAATWL